MTPKRVRSKMARAVELAALVGAEPVDRALGLAAVAGRFDEGDLASILGRLDTGDDLTVFAAALDDHSTQPGTSVWDQFGR
jgi:hypothetical protein